MKKTIDELIQELKQKPLLRSLQIESREETENGEKIIELSVSSEYPVETYYGFEILGHEPKEIRLERFKSGAAVRDSHYGDVIAVIEKVWIDREQKKLRVRIRFSNNNERAIIVWKDIIDGIRNNVSIRFKIHAMRFIEEKDGKEYIRITDWEPIHLSIEPDPADPSVGPGRSDDDEFIVFPFNPEGDYEEQIRKFNEANTDRKIKIVSSLNREEKTLDKTQLTDEQIKKMVDDQVRSILENKSEEEKTQFRNYCQSIYEVARDFDPRLKEDLMAVADKYIGENKSLRDFYQYARKQSADPQAVVQPDSFLDIPQRELNKISLRNIVLYQLGRTDIVSDKDIGPALEASRAVAKKLNKNPNGMYLSHDQMVQQRTINLSRMSARERALVIGTPSQGGILIGEDFTQFSFIELLQKKSIFLNAGVESMFGLKNNVPMYRELDNFTYYHKGEGSGLTPSDVTFSKETMEPHVGGALGSYTYEFLLQDPLVVDAYLNRRLSKTCALGLDRDIGYGNGVGDVPLGIKYWAGTGGVVGAGFNWSKVLDLSGQLYTADAEELGNIQWLSRGSLREAMKGVVRFAGSDRALVTDDNTMNGYDYKLISNQINPLDLFFGIMNSVLVGYWNEVDVKASEYDDEAFKAGDVLIRALQVYDVFGLNPAGITITEGVVPTNPA